MGKRLALLAVLMMVPTLICTGGSVVAGDEWLDVVYTDPEVVYTGFWRVVENPDALGGSELMGSRSLNSYVEFTFSGTGVRWIGTKSAAMGYASVYLDGELVATQVDGYSPEALNQQVIFELDGLAEGKHVLRIVPEEARGEAASMNFVAVNGFQYIPTLDKAIESARAAFDKPIGGLALGDALGAFYPQEAADRLREAIAEAEELLGSSDRAQVTAAVANLNRLADEMINSAVTVVIPDDSGRGRVGIITGGPKWIEGPLGLGLSFDGVNDLVRINDIFVSETSSIEFWLKMPEAVGSSWQTIIACRGANTDRSPGLWHQGDGNYQTLHLSTLPNWTGFNHIGPEGEGSEFDPEQWYHIALVKDGENYTLYVDAKEVITVWTGTGMTPGEYIEFGQRNIDIDELRVWDRVRTQEEIAADYLQPLTGDEPGLIGYWPFERVRIQ